MRNLAKQFTNNSILHNKYSFPICIGQENADKNIDWIFPDILNSFKGECPFKIYKHVLSMSISENNTLSIDGMLIGRGNNIQDEKYVSLTLTKPEFVDQLTQMLKCYKKNPWYITIDGQDITCNTDYINSIF